MGREYLALADAAAERGGRLVPQVHSRELAPILGFQTNLPFDCLPEWSVVRARPLQEQRAALIDPSTRRRLVDEALRGEYCQNGSSGPTPPEPKPPEWDLMRVIDDAGRYPSVAAMAAARNTTPVDLVIDLSLERGFKQFFAQPTSNLNSEDVLEMLRHPRTVIALSDSGAHVSQIMDTSIPTHFLAHWVRGEQAFTWEQGIKKLTSDPAALVSFNDRGTLREGFIADIAVIDPAKIGPGHVEVARDLPAKGLRIKQKATGVLATVVSGTVVLDAGEHTGNYPGKLIRGALACRG
jgi:N-acyl-D-aspartate/D-glutamate deacylase